jgi:protein SCO1/2
MRHILAVLLLLFLAACGKPATVKPVHAIDISWQHAHPDFHLSDVSGKPRSLADFGDKVVLVFFGYTHCPEVCPTTMADLAQAMKQLGPDADKVQVIFITLDPARDTPQLLGKFVPYFDPSFIGLYGDEQATSQAAQSFGVAYRKHMEKDGSYTIDHTDSTYLIGRGGKPLWMSRYGERSDYLVEDIRRLLSSNGG